MLPRRVEQGAKGSAQRARGTRPSQREVRRFCIRQFKGSNKHACIAAPSKRYWNRWLSPQAASPFSYSPRAYNRKQQVPCNLMGWFSRLLDCAKAAYSPHLAPLTRALAKTANFWKVISAPRDARSSHNAKSLHCSFAPDRTCYVFVLYISCIIFVYSCPPRTLTTFA